MLVFITNSYFNVKYLIKLVIILFLYGILVIT